jgi:hypothetical protein
MFGHTRFSQKIIESIPLLLRHSLGEEFRVIVSTLQVREKVKWNSGDNSIAVGIFEAKNIETFGELRKKEFFPLSSGVVFVRFQLRFELVRVFECHESTIKVPIFSQILFVMRILVDKEFLKDRWFFGKEKDIGEELFYSCNHIMKSK